MPKNRKLFSICIPAYNRAKFLAPLLDSIYVQNFNNFEIVICEDHSKERLEISKIVETYNVIHSNTIRYFENEENLGYDGNIRNLVEKAEGTYCFFMGNDDLMCPDALKYVADAISKYSNVGFVLKSYAWFDETPEKINQEIRYFTEERLLMAGKESISVCFRRSGVISGFIIHRDTAQKASTFNYDGTLYYQMHLSGEVLTSMNAVAIPKIIVLCRNSELPEFGNSVNEANVYTPGQYTPEARINMISGAIRIAKDLDDRYRINILEDIMRDYANYFYPYIKDQLRLSFSDYFHLYLSFGKLGFFRFPMFHVYFILCYFLGEHLFDDLTRWVRKFLGRSPHFQISR